MKNLFHIKLNYFKDKISIEIALSSRFKALMAEATAICLAFAHISGSGTSSARGLAVLQKLAFDPADKATYSAKEVEQALTLACLAGLHFAAQGRSNDNLARVLVMLAQATPCRIPKIKLPTLKKLKLVSMPSELAFAAYEILRRNSSPASEIPVFAAYQVAYALSSLTAPPDSIRKLICHLGRETLLFVATLTKLAEMSRRHEHSSALAAARRN